jgi:hypothetical protein
VKLLAQLVKQTLLTLCISAAPEAPSVQLRLSALIDPALSSAARHRGRLGYRRVRLAGDSQSSISFEPRFDALTAVGRDQVRARREQASVD